MYAKINACMYVIQSIINSLTHRHHWAADHRTMRPMISDECCSRNNSEFRSESLARAFLNYHGALGNAGDSCSSGLNDHGVRRGCGRTRPCTRLRVPLDLLAMPLKM